MDDLEIYPQIWGSDAQEALGYILAYYRQSLDFFSQAAARADIVITFRLLLAGIQPIMG